MQLEISSRIIIMWCAMTQSFPLDNYLFHHHTPSSRRLHETYIVCVVIIYGLKLWHIYLHNNYYPSSHSLSLLVPRLVVNNNCNCICIINRAHLIYAVYNMSSSSLYVEREWFSAARWRCHRRTADNWLFCFFCSRFYSKFMHSSHIWDTLKIHKIKMHLTAAAVGLWSC